MGHLQTQTECIWYLQLFAECFRAFSYSQTEFTRFLHSVAHST